MSDHAWCRDVPRDLAVRAAEDGRGGPLPTLEKCIETARAMMPKSVSGSSAPEQENKANGMRTERITLEMTHDLDAPLGGWIVQVIDESLGYDESVRVVEECCLDRINMGEVIRQRDAAIRERDAHKEEYYKLRSERITQALTADRFASAVAEADRLRARVAELEAAPVAESATTPPPARGWLTEEERRLIESLEGTFQQKADALRSQGLHGHVDNWERKVKLFRSLLARSSPPEVSPPPARGWLTPDEIAVCVGLRDYCRGTWETWGRKDTLWLNRATTLDALLARSTPPEANG